MSIPYLAVPLQSQIAGDLLAYAVTLPQEAWSTYYNFVATPAPMAIMGKDPFLLALAGKRKFRGGILRMRPSTCYNWHVDTDRKVGLNMLLADDGESRCLFLSGEPGVVFDTVELKYRPETYYVFDTQTPHTILNTSSFRYLFSLEFLDTDCAVTFTGLCEDIKGIEHGH